MSYDTVIYGGALVTSGGLRQADLGINGGRIAAIGQGLEGRERIDASGLLVLPGAIDPHVHLQMPAGPVTSSDDFYTGTVAAAIGGTTTIIDFVEPEGEDLLEALAARRAEAEGRAVIDFSFHMTLTNARPQTLAQVQAVRAAGVTSFKTYLTYEGFRLSDDEFLQALSAVGEAGSIALVHAENDAAIRLLRARFKEAGCTEPKWHARSRPAATEGEAVERGLSLAEVAPCPLYVVHISTGRGAAAVARARGRGQTVWGETCPQYLVLTEQEYDRPGFEGAKFVCSPPLRCARDNDDLWRGLSAGELSTVGTDHCPFYYGGQKDLGNAAAPPSFDRIPGGVPGIESRLALVYTYGVRAGRLSVEQWVDVCCSAPARIFDLRGKGSLAEGNDADVVLFDPEREVVLSMGTLHENCDYTPYEGMRLRGYPVLTLAHGRVLARDGEFAGAPHRGSFLTRS